MLKAKVRSIFSVVYRRYFIGEVCVNTCRRKYCVSKIDKISFQFCFSYDSLTSPKKIEVTLYEYLFLV
jgi:hypothetical protein